MTDTGSIRCVFRNRRSITQHQNAFFCTVESSRVRWSWDNHFRSGFIRLAMFDERVTLHGEVSWALLRPVRPGCWLVAKATWFAVSGTWIFGDDLTGLLAVEVRLVTLRNRSKGAMVVLKVIDHWLTASACGDKQ